MEKRPRSILVLGWVVGVLYLLRAVALLFPYELADEVLSLTTAPAAKIVMGFMVVVLSLGSLALMGLTTILFFVWSYQAHENARLLAPGAPLSNGPGVMIWSYFIPFVNLFLPYSAMKEVFSASDAAARAGDDEDYRLDSTGGTLLSVGWIVYVGTNIIISAMNSLGTLSSSSELEMLAIQAPLVFGNGALSFAWCIYLSRLQDRAIARQATHAP
jgi:hypothetical protein